MKLANVIGMRDPMIFGHFIEHFHRQVYGGIFDPTSPLSDEDGFRTDVIEAIKKYQFRYFDGRAVALFPHTIGKTRWAISAAQCSTKLGG